MQQGQKNNEGSKHHQSQVKMAGSGRKLEMGGRDRAVNNHCVIRTVIKHTLRTIGGVHMEMT